MARQSSTAAEDAERLQEELPKAFTAPLEATARILEQAARLGLEATLWPTRALPSSLRDGTAQVIRAALATSAMFPHALTRAARRTADRLFEDS